MAEQPMEVEAKTGCHQPQLDAKPQPGDLQDKHVCITHTDYQKDYAVALEVALKDRYKVIRVAGDSVLAIVEMKKSQKVIMMISKEYLKSSKYPREIECIEMLTSKRQQEVLIPVLCDGFKYEDLPARLQFGSAVPSIGVTKEYPKAGEENYWKTVVENVDKLFPVLSTVTSGVGYGLAWGHFFGYLQFILTNLSLRMQNADKSDWDIRADATHCDKMIAIFPHKGREMRKLSDFDSDIQSVCSKSTKDPIKLKHTIDFPGHPKKDFSCGIFKATVNNTEYVFFAETPATLNTLTKMRDSNFVKFAEDDYQVELERVKASLENILRTHKDEHIGSRLASIAFLDYDDRDILPEESQGSLAMKIAHVINDRLFLDKK